MHKPLVVVRPLDSSSQPLTALEIFDMNSSNTSQFSEINLHLAVYDDTEKKLPPIQNAKAARTSLREMLLDGVYQSQSQAIVNMTIEFLEQEARSKDQARKKALLSKLKLKTKTDAQLKKISKYMEKMAESKREEKQKQRRLEMGLPANFKLKKSLIETQAIKRFQTMCKESGKENLKLPKIEEKGTKVEVTTELVNSSDDDSDLECTHSYGNFLSKKLGRTDSTNSLGSTLETTSHLSLPTIKTDFTVPSRPPPRASKRIKVPGHLERFRYMRLKN